MAIRPLTIGVACPGLMEAASSTLTVAAPLGQASEFVPSAASLDALVRGGPPMPQGGWSPPESIRVLQGFERLLSQTPDAKWLAAKRQVAFLVQMGADTPAANTYREFLAYEMVKAVVGSERPDHAVALAEIMARPYSLADLSEFAVASSLSQNFGLESRGRYGNVSEEARLSLRAIQEMGVPQDIAEILRRFVGSLDQRRVPARPALKAIASGLFDIRTSRDVVRALSGADEDPLAFLRLTRLAHVLSPSAQLLGTNYKAAEISQLLHADSGSDSTSFPRDGQPSDIDGTIHTGFLRDRDLVESVREFWRTAATLDGISIPERRERWRMFWSGTNALGGASAPRRIAACTGFFGDQTARELENRLREDGGDIEIVVLSRRQMEAYARRRSPNRAVIADDVEAAFERSDMPGRRWRILLVDLAEKFPDKAPHEVTRDLAAAVRHDYCHIVQIERKGEAWGRANFVASEVDAYVVEQTACLAAGDDDFYLEATGLTPYGFVTGLRMFVEQIYLRARQLPLGL